MAAHIKINNIALLKSEETEINYIPAAIDGEGEINIENNFNNYTSKQGNLLTNSLRGYPLKGCQFKVPENYIGVVVTESKTASLQDDAERNLNVQNVFNDFVYWNWDKEPTINDAIQQTMSWMDLAEALHAPIEKEPKLEIKEEQ